MCSSWEPVPSPSLFVFPSDWVSHSVKSMCAWSERSWSISLPVQLFAQAACKGGRKFPVPKDVALECHQLQQKGPEPPACCPAPGFPWISEAQP